MAYPHLSNFNKLGYALGCIKSNINNGLPFLNFENVEVVVIFDGFAEQTKNIKVAEDEFNQDEIEQQQDLIYKKKYDVFNKKREEILEMKKKKQISRSFIHL